MTTFAPNKLDPYYFVDSPAYDVHRQMEESAAGGMDDLTVYADGDAQDAVYAKAMEMQSAPYFDTEAAALLGVVSVHEPSQN